MNMPIQNLHMAAPAAPAKPKKEPYDRYLMIGYLAIIALVGITIAWSFMNIKGAVIAAGTVVVEGKPKTLQHLDGGIVGEILVREGQSVSEGDIVMRLDPTMLESNQVIVQTRLYETMARVARLEAERDNESAINWPQALIDERASNPTVDTAMTGQEKLFKARRAAGSGQVSQLNQRIAQFNDQIAGLNSLIRSKNNQAMKIREEADSKQILVDKGWLAKPVILALEREELRLQGDIANHQSDISRLRNSINETNVQIGQIRRELQAEVLAELRQADTEASDLREQLTTASDQRRRIDVITPVSGKVHNMSVTTIGGVVGPGQELMQIIPQDVRLIIDAQVQPADIDQIFPGQETTIRLSAFNIRTTPELNGFVIKASPDRLIDPVTGFPYYSVKVEIPPEELALLPENLTLLPGMPADCFMTTEKRSVMSYLLKPATDAMTKAGREE